MTGACSLLTSFGGLTDGTDEAEGDAGSLDGPGGDIAAQGDAPFDPDAAGTIRGPYATAVLDDNPVVYLRFGEANGSKQTLDEVSRRFIPLPPAVDLGAPGALENEANTAIELDGSAHLTMPVGQEFSAFAAYTIEVWVNQAPSPPGLAFIVDHENYEGGGRNGWNLLILGDIASERRISNSTHTAAGTAYAAGGGWHHVVATMDGTRLFLFVDGALRADVPAALAIAPTNRPWTIGGQSCSDCSGNSLIGALDELAIYDRALPASRITHHYNLGR